MSRCQSCEAEIEWGTTTNGRPMPLDAQPSPNGKWTFIGGRIRYATADDLRLMRPLYVAHWGSCPNAEQHRRSK